MRSIEAGRRNFHVARDSHHFEHVRLLAYHAEGTTDGVLIGPVLLGQALADRFQELRRDFGLPVAVSSELPMNPEAVAASALPVV